MAKKAKKKRARARKPSPRDTATTHWVSFRLPHGLIEMLDAHVKVESERTGYPVSRTQGLAKIIRDACERKEIRDSGGKVDIPSDGPGVD